MLIKPSHLILVSAFVIFSNCSRKSEPVFSISGTIPTLKNTTFYLSKQSDNSSVKNSVIDSLLVDENGSFSTHFFIEPNLFTLVGDGVSIPLAIDKGQHILIEGESKDNLIISGSIDTQLLQQYEAFRIESLNRLVKSVRSEIKIKENQNSSEEEIAKLRSLEVENYNEHIKELTNFVKTKMGTSIAILATASRWKSDVDFEFLQKLVTNFEQKNPKLESTAYLKSRINLLKKSSIGSIFSGVSISDKDGNNIILTPEKATYTLIDFWASWCPPCRTESGLLVDLYKKYDNKGFEIYGISLDTNKEKWIFALEKDQRNWPNGSTLEGFETPIAINYGLNSLPINYLIDSSGKIIAVNLHGKKLEEKINSLFKE